MSKKMDQTTMTKRDFSRDASISTQLYKMHLFAQADTSSRVLKT